MIAASAFAAVFMVGLSFCDISFFESFQIFKRCHSPSVGASHNLWGICGACACLVIRK